MKKKPTTLTSQKFMAEITQKNIYIYVYIYIYIYICICICICIYIYIYVYVYVYVYVYAMDSFACLFDIFYYKTAQQC